MAAGPCPTARKNGRNVFAIKDLFALSIVLFHSQVYLCTGILEGLMTLPQFPLVALRYMLSLHDLAVNVFLYLFCFLIYQHRFECQNFLVQTGVESSCYILIYHFFVCFEKINPG